MFRIINNHYTNLNGKKIKIKIYQLIYEYSPTRYYAEDIRRKYWNKFKEYRPSHN